MMSVNETAAEDSDLKIEEDEMDTIPQRPRKKHIHDQILKQLEFYLGDANLTKDRFLAQKLKEDPHLPIDIFLSFNKIRSLTSDVTDLVTAIKKSNFLALTEDETKVVRKTQIKRRDNQDDCTIYVENIPTDADHEWLQKIFSSYGNVLYVSIPKYKNKINKGFAFIEFDIPESATKSVEAFGAAGCRLPTNVSSEQLLSIRTFEDDGGKALLNAGRKMIDLTLPLIANLPASEEKEPGEGLKRKRAFTAPHEAGGKKPKEAEEVITNNAEENISVKINTSVSLDKVVDKPMEKQESPDSDSDEEVGDEANEENSDEKKDEKKLGKKLQRLEVASLGLQILPKKEWKRLRNSYLNTQRQKMAQLKRKLTEAKILNQEKEGKEEIVEDEEIVESEVITNKPNLQNYDFVPGVILKLVPEQFIEDIKEFKKEAKAIPGVAYIDILPHRVEVYIRCESAEVAKSLLSAIRWPGMQLLEGEEEEKYWQKINEDRSQKMQKKRKDRGREKLVQRAKNFQITFSDEEEKSAITTGINSKCSHIRFTDDDDDHVRSITEAQVKSDEDMPHSSDPCIEESLVEQSAAN